MTERIYLDANATTPLRREARAAMVAAAIAPWPLGYTGALYGWTAVLLSAAFVLLSAQVGLRSAGEGDRMLPEKRLFAFSIAYLFILFGAVVVDHMWPL